MKEQLPVWALEWLNLIIVAGQVSLFLAAAWLLRRLISRVLNRVGERYKLPFELVLGARRTLGFLVHGTALLLVLERLGVSGTVLWTALSGFVAVAAVAFFAAWSVLSNIFCTLLIFITGVFRLNDQVEILENGEKPGLKGRVIDINLIYTTLQEPGMPARSVLQVPNSLFFQRSVRRWRGEGAIPVAVAAPAAERERGRGAGADSAGSAPAGGGGA
jgi:small-conductance mechanosensitive channel